MSDVQVGDEILITEEDGFNPFCAVTKGQTYEIVEIKEISDTSEIVIINDDGNPQVWMGFIERRKWENEDNNVKLISNNNDNTTMSDVQVGDELVITDLEAFYDDTDLRDCGDLTEGNTYSVTEIYDDGEITFYDDEDDYRTFEPNNGIRFIDNNMDTNFQENDIVRIIDESYYAEDVHKGDLFRVVSSHRIEPVSSKTTAEHQTFDDDGNTIELVHRIERDPFDDVTLNGHDVSYNEETDMLEVGSKSLDVEAVLDIVETLNDVRG
jgi:hypothetical protein